MESFELRRDKEMWWLKLQGEGTVEVSSPTS